MTAEDQVPVVEGEEVHPEPELRARWIGPKPATPASPAKAAGRCSAGRCRILALLWTGYTAWSAGRALADQPLSSPAIAQWVAILAGPLALMGLVWLMFGRTRRKEAERFTRSVVAMRRRRVAQDILGCAVAAD